MEHHLAGALWVMWAWLMARCSGAEAPQKSLARWFSRRPASHSCTSDSTHPTEPSVATPPTPKTVALRIELLEVVPLVWRRVLVADHWTLASLHHYLQWALGWTDSHAHEFE